MNPNLQHLDAYPFEKLAELKRGVRPETRRKPVLLSMGEPRHEPPQIVLRALADNLGGVSQYPGTRGSSALRKSISEWLEKRFQLNTASVDPEKHVLPVNGTREALFAFAQCVLDSTSPKTKVLIPNPFYQIYEGAATLAGMQSRFYNTASNTGYQPDFDKINDRDWEKCQLIYICSPGNPTGAVIGESELISLIERAHKYNFIIASDECYSEIYADENSPPCGLLQACQKMGNDKFSHCIVFHSLSKRSNLPGMRSGFVAGDCEIIENFFRYRTYHGCSMSPVVQAASVVAWNDERHVRENRCLYREKFAAVLSILSGTLDVTAPAAGFYLWPELPVDDESFTVSLYRKQNVTVLPGSYLARWNDGINPGKNHVRIALVAELADCIEATERIRETLNSI
jgi:N-succinyldiaminopimelate aminotransferase